MKNSLIFYFIVFITFSAFSQEIFISSTEDKLYKLNLDNCTYEFVVDVQAQVFDISFHPNGDLFGIDSGGGFYEIDIVSGNTVLIYNFESQQTFNSLTIAGDGTVYTVGDFGELWSYDILGDTEIFHGSIGHQATGDLTFFNGNLYAAVSGDKIVLIDINNPSNNSIIIDENVPGDIFGIVSFAADCNNVSSYAITNGNSEIYQIDFETNSLNFICQLDIEAGGGASTFEFLASSPIVIQNTINTNPGCGLNNGSIQVAADGGTGQLVYSIDGVNFQTSDLFENLSVGSYTISIKDDNNCNTSQEITLSPSNMPVITGGLPSNVTCQRAFGSLTIFATGGVGPLNFSIDGTNFQTSNTFDSLSIGNYTITVIDANGCSDVENMEILLEDLPTIADILVTNTSCGNDNGAIEVLVNGGTGELEYTINNNNIQTSNTFENLPANNYRITVTDTNNCTDSMDVEILAEAVAMITDISATNTTCGGNSGSITILANSASGPLEYSIDGTNFQLSNVFENLFSGDYSVAVMDPFNCILTGEISVAGSPGLFVDSMEMVPAGCGESNGSLTVDISGGTGLVQASLDGSIFQFPLSFENLTSGAYTIRIIDELACLVDTSFVISQTECPVYIPNVFSPNNDGNNDFFEIYPHPGFQGVFRTIKIYDRWGTEILTANDFDPATFRWDGTYKEEKLKNNVYVYFIEYTTGNGISKTIEGDITIIR